MHQDLQEALDFHHAVLAEGARALVGYELAKTIANIVLLSEIPTTYDKRSERQVNAGNLLLRGVPGVGKTFFGVILAAISDAKFARIQGRADLQPTEVVGFQMINPSTGQLVTEFGPMASAEIILLDEINRIPLKSQSAFLEGLQDRTITVGKDTYDLPAFSFAIATMNPVELGQGTFPLSEAATDRFAAMVQIGYLPKGEEEKLVDFDFKRMTLRPLLSKERIIQLRGVISDRVFLHKIPSMLEYKSPSACEMPTVTTYVVEDHDKNGPFGAKEVGQGPLLPIMPAVANAVFDAVSVRVDENPISFEKVFAALQAKKEGKEGRFGPSNGPDGVPAVDFGDSLKIKTPWQGGDGTAWNEPKREKKAAK